MCDLTPVKLNNLLALVCYTRICHHYQCKAITCICCASLAEVLQEMCCGEHAHSLHIFTTSQGTLTGPVRSMPCPTGDNNMQAISTLPLHVCIWCTDDVPAEPPGNQGGWRGRERARSPSPARPHSEPPARTNSEVDDAGASPPPPLISVGSSDAEGGSAGEGGGARGSRTARADSLPPLTSDEQRGSGSDEEA